MDQICFLRDRNVGECGSDRGTSAYVSLGSCNDDIIGHLAGCHLSRERLTEYQLILARAGLFDLPDEQLQCMKICPKHRHNLGRFWRPVRSCQYPAHTGRPRNIKGNRVINLQVAREVHTMYDKTVHIGSRKLNIHQQIGKNLKKITEDNCFNFFSNLY